MPGPLTGIRVLEWAMWHIGPGAGYMLGDLGAEIIKIERPGVGDPQRGIATTSGIPAGLPGGRNYLFELGNRNKKSLTLDISQPQGREVVYRLIPHCDIFLQNFRLGVAEKVGLDYPTLSRYNPRLIYARATGYGVKGADSRRPAIDPMGLARSGIMTSIGERDMPPLMPGFGIADQMTATMLAYGVLAALVARERLGVGQEVDVSLLGSMIHLQALSINGCLMLGRDLNRSSRSRAANPLMNYYRCADGRWLMLALFQSDRYWKDFCQALGMPELAGDPRFADMKLRADNRQELIAKLDQVFATRPAAQWEEILKQKKDLIFSRILSQYEAATDAQSRENGYVLDIDHPTLGPVKMVGTPLGFSRTPAGPQSCAPECGQHTEEILLELGGYTWEDIGRLKEAKVIG